MIRAIEQGLREVGGLGEGACVLVALSGGADSTALLHVLAHLAPRHGWRLEVAHLHHGLRGAAADDDQVFCRQLAGRLGLAFHTRRVDVRRKAKRSGVSLEMASRSSRYDFLAAIARKQSGVVVTAHTQDDQAETLVLRLARGASPRGLRGVLPRTTWNRVEVVRPMLKVRHHQAISYLKRNKLAWREDDSNADDIFLRNRVRHEVLPLLTERLNPGANEAIARLAGQVREEEAWLDEVTSAALATCRSERRDELSAAALRAHPVALQRRMLRRWLLEQGVTPVAMTMDFLQDAVRLCLRSTGTRGLSLPAGGGRLSRTYDRMKVLTADIEPGPRGFRQRLLVPGRTRLSLPGLQVEVEWTTGYGQPATGRRGLAEAWLARAPLGRAGLYLRNAKPGDRMRPLGMRGQRKLQDIFTDLKVPARERWVSPVLVCREEVLWVPGYTIAHAWRVRDTEERAFRIRVQS